MFAYSDTYSLSMEEAYLEEALLSETINQTAVTGETYSDGIVPYSQIIMDKAMSLFQQSTDAQKEAINADFQKPLLVVAGPGTGKTRTIIARILMMLTDHTISPANILAITFTKKAATEMQERLEKNIGKTANSMDVQTFHSFAAKVLRMIEGRSGVNPTASTIDQQDAEKMLNEAARAAFSEETYNTLFKRGATERHYLSAFADETYANLTATPWNPPTELIHYDEIKNAYKQEKILKNCLDYDDLERELNHALDIPEVRYLMNTRYRRILVDEYQDTNALEHSIIEKMAGYHRSLTCVGDPDQSIYRWRRADVTGILSFEKTWPDCRIVHLEHNFRSTPQIVEAALNLIKHNAIRRDKNMIPVREPGNPINYIEYADAQEEAFFIGNEVEHRIKNGQSPTEIAIICRTSPALTLIQNELIRRGIYYIVHAGFNVRQKIEYKWIAAWIRIAINPADETAFLHAFKTRSRGIGEKTLSDCIQIARETDQTAIQILRAKTRESIDSGKTKFKKAQLFFDALDEISLLINLNVDCATIVSTIVDITDLNTDIKEEEDKIASEPNAKKKEQLAFHVQNRKVSRDDVISRAAASETITELSANIALTNERESEENPAVWLGTIHASKALEFETVFMPCAEDIIMPSPRIMKDEKSDELTIQEERNLAFVGITRAKNDLYMSYTRYRNLNGENHTPNKSQYIIEMQHAS